MIKPIHFQGVYKIEAKPNFSEISLLEIGNVLKDQANPGDFVHIKTGGVPMWITNDQRGQDADQFKPRLDKALKLQKWLTEPNNPIHFLWNIIVEKVLDPIGQLSKVESDLTAKAKPMVFERDAQGQVHGSVID